MRDPWFAFAALCLAVAPASGQERQAEASAPGVVIPDTERHTLQSAFVDEEFKIHVYLPRGYHEMRDSLPVVYLLDAEYSFGGVAYTIRRLIRDDLIGPVLLVGVAYERPYDEYYVRRQRDFTPTRSHLDAFPAAGYADQFARFLDEELIPFVNQSYRVDPHDRTIVGLSFSGLFATYCLFTRPGMFDRFVIVSPSLWWDSGVVFRHEAAHRQRSHVLAGRAYFAAGSQDGPNILRDLARLESVLADRTYEGLEYAVRRFPDETHRTVFLVAVSHGLRFVFARR